ncbi:hypothetical protein Ddye_015812 [Dipteronia dyeriana]|uniref:Phytocyanin domain-containing protein n=1 Tax=Dipteronia dyeriana TaxID=168575 RepID=A0AAD9U6A6_9ROSI|nr:hypothetical protein Ddye_015812 [Dipteronia dyeriana]
MGLVKSTSSGVFLMIMITMSSICTISMAAEYKLRDDLDSVGSGWTIMDENNDYYYDVPVPVEVGASIVLMYDNTSHNLVEVRLEDFDTCNLTSPIAKYNSGRDNITFDREGNYYFICGFPNHCLRGEKMIFMTAQLLYPPPPLMTTNSESTPPSTSSTSGLKIAPQNKS